MERQIDKERGKGWEEEFNDQTIKHRLPTICFLGGIFLLSFSSCEKETTREKYWKKIDFKREKEKSSVHYLLLMIFLLPQKFCSIIMKIELIN